MPSVRVRKKDMHRWWWVGVLQEKPGPVEWEELHVEIESSCAANMCSLC